MQNNSENMRAGQGENPDLWAGENFFEQHGMMPGSSSQQIGNKAISSIEQEKENEVGAEGEKKMENVVFRGDPVLTNDENTVDSGDKQSLASERSFSNGKKFTTNDGKITEAQIRKLKDDPAAAYEEIQFDREEYLKKSFGRIFGEQQ